jgi:hypothetical protein
VVKATLCYLKLFKVCAAETAAAKH